MTDDRVQQRIDTAMAELSVYERKVGSFSKPYAFVCAKEMKPSAWWAMFGKYAYVPVILSIAQRVLPQPVVRGRCGEQSVDLRVDQDEREVAARPPDGGQDGLCPRDAQAHAGEAGGTLQAAGCNLA